jgi:alanyl aminopeptidase
LAASPAPSPLEKTAAPAGADDESASPEKARLPAGVVPVQQRLALTLDPSAERFSGRVEIVVDVATPRRTVWLNAKDMRITKAEIVAGKRQVARAAIADGPDGFLRLDVDTPIPAGRATIAIDFDAAFRNDLQGLYRVNVDGDWYVFSQFEALSAREAFPCFDEPAFKIPFAISVTHPAGIVVVGNTRTASQDVRNNGAAKTVTLTFQETRPLPTYLLAFVAGPLDVVQGPVLGANQARRALSIRGLSPKGKGHLLKASLLRTADVVRDQEQAFGIAYPYDKLDIVATPDFGAGAMENAGLITFRDSLLYVDGNSAVAQQKSNLGIIAHEVAHQWFGNLVTMGFWDDLWLNEAFATWRAARTVHRLRPDFDGAFDLRETASWAMNSDSLSTARQIRQPIENRGDVENAFDGITYSKGAAVIAMFEEWLELTVGPDTFMKGTRAYLAAHAHGTGTTADFLAAISTAAGQDIAPAFSTFLDQPGVPFLNANCVVTDGSAKLDINTSRYLPIGSLGDTTLRYRLPVCASTFERSTRSVRCGVIDGDGSLDLGVAACPAFVHPNADGAGYYRFTMPAAAMRSLGAQLPKMTPGERLSFGNALNAAFSRATVPFGELLAAALPLADDEEVSVAFVPARMMSFARLRVLANDKSRLAAVDRKIAALYQPTLNRLGLVDRKNDTPRDRERRAAVAEAVAETSPALRTTLAPLAQRYLDAPHDALAKDLVPVALRALVEVDVKTPAAFDALLARAKAEPDPRLRGDILRALASTREPDLVDRAIGLIFDENLRINEKAIGLYVQGSDPRTSRHTFDVMKARYDDIAGELPEDWRARFPAAARGLCSEADAVEVEAFFGPKVPSVPGLDRNLAQTVEGIRLCAALADAHRAAIEKSLR